MNKVILIGNLAKDPEIRYSQSAEPIAVCKFLLAVNRRFKREGEADADFINCVALGKTGEFIERYFKKGRKIAVTGRLSIRPYEDQTGQKRSWTEVVVEEAHFVDSKPQSDKERSQGPDNDDYYAEQAAAHKPSAQSAPPMPSPEDFKTFDEEDDELPF